MLCLYLVFLSLLPRRCSRWIAVLLESPAPPSSLSLSYSVMWRSRYVTGDLARFWPNVRIPLFQEIARSFLTARDHNSYAITHNSSRVLEIVRNYKNRTYNQHNANHTMSRGSQILQLLQKCIYVFTRTLFVYSLLICIQCTV